jgi:hypothetical protein
MNHCKLCEQEISEGLLCAECQQQENEALVQQLEYTRKITDGVMESVFGFKLCNTK